MKFNLTLPIVPGAAPPETLVYYGPTIPALIGLDETYNPSTPAHRHPLGELVRRGYDVEGSYVEAAWPRRVEMKRRWCHFGTRERDDGR